MACRSAASSTISTRERWPPRCGSGRRSDERAHIMIRSPLVVVVTLLAGSVAWAAPAPVPRAVVVAGMKKADCSLPLREALEGVDVSPLDRKLKLVEVPCWRAAYQAGSILFVLDPATPARAKLIRFQYWSNKKLGWSYALTMPSFAAETKT